ncbi:protein YqhJ [Escherichia coli str. K-12 substr. MG1655]|uniref:Protein YqhJ n=1 Tax=Escherichia coli (strain K12) TaxID=83333 RepID=YQHJ_ECOLI|nr:MULTISPECIES: protein YqhJ [Enterobacteriaceae]YP_010051198.1 protein YqhJ [Escherichia coli str. K-12 substr. MG1655]P0DSG4.1 RecName: Full=Protein YqhJ [Escherichia coli K-12]MCJ8702251.1 hypothetical protein [Escherichia coli]QNV50539.1 protein YqhJ [Escherichia coli str. K-12 substr. MG1655]
MKYLAFLIKGKTTHFDVGK